MNMLKSLLIGTLSLSVLSGCITNLVGVGDTEFSLELSGPENLDRSGVTYIAKNMPQLNGKCGSRAENKKYFLWGNFCGFGRFPPEKIELQYAKWKPYNQIPHPMYPHMVKYVDSLPASAWQTYTLYPKKVMAEVKHQQKPSHTPFAPKAIAKKHILVYLDINADGQVTIRDEAQYGYVNNIESFR